MSEPTALEMDYRYQIAQLTKERDELKYKLSDALTANHALDAVAKNQTSYANQLAAKCAEMRNYLQYVHDHAAAQGGVDLKLIHALSDQCGQGWISPEQKKAIEEQHCMEMAAVMTATIQNTASTVKDRIPKENPYWTQAYCDVCTAIDREMKLIEQKKVLAEALQRIINESELWEADIKNSRLGTALIKAKQALEACKI